MSGKPTIRMWDPTGPSGNAFAIMGAVGAALKAAGQRDKVAEFQGRATSGDYENLVRAVFDYVEVVRPSGYEPVEPEDVP
jgi:hypothetical protein